jgi:integrase
MVGLGYQRLMNLSSPQSDCHNCFLVRMRVGHGKKVRELQTYLPAILDIVWHSGRRISAVLALRFEDLRLNEGGPHGAIQWPASSDKCGKACLAPMSPEARRAIDSILADRPGIGKGFLFPSFTREGEPVRQDAVALWLRSAEVLAGVPKQDGSLFHAYRRSWATSRKFFPLVDVAAAGGWSDTATLLKCYQQADPETMYRVVSEPAKLTERLAQNSP